MCCEERFERELRERGLRLTPQREMILRVLHEAADHPLAEEIYGWVSAVSSAFELSTVYRTLELLQDLNLVASFDLGDGQRRYELLTLHAPHHHLQCLGCGKLVTVDAQALQPLLDHLAQAYGFRAQLDHRVIPGYCQGCQTATGQELEAGVTRSGGRAR